MKGFQVSPSRLIKKRLVWYTKGLLYVNKFDKTLNLPCDRSHVLKKIYWFCFYTGNNTTERHIRTNVTLVGRDL